MDYNLHTKPKEPLGSMIRFENLFLVLLVESNSIEYSASMFCDNKFEDKTPSVYTYAPAVMEKILEGFY